MSCGTVFYLYYYSVKSIERGEQNMDTGSSSGAGGRSKKQNKCTCTQIITFLGNLCTTNTDCCDSGIPVLFIWFKSCCTTLLSGFATHNVPFKINNRRKRNWKATLHYSKIYLIHWRKKKSIIPCVIFWRHLILLILQRYSHRCQSSIFCFCSGFYLKKPPQKHL